MKKLLVVIPAFNEAQTISQVIDSIPRKISGITSTRIVLIDDGSTDQTAEIALRKKIVVVRHLINRGLGAALATGIQYARLTRADYMITMDADGQHLGGDVKKIVRTLITNNADVVIGSRLLNPSGMPLSRQVINFLSNIVTLLLFSRWTSDSQSGLRGFSHRAIERIKINSQRMEVSSEIIRELARLKLAYLEVPIKSIYTRYSLRKGQRISNAPQVFWKLILQKFA
ncbi:TPA: glycosyltransferase family 2 protein [Patescibacteria group bacterium]|uniref:Glycosyltransferase 2-like domain-containing protein n=1 Tax=Candidatus Gottesmanbacteria bacterium GW2011_GWA1_43_11 TaxID=1618436 RepID=A0A0G1FHM4_9BACT|nr:MAG: hypothetical protein UV59_C0001G0066 [Candidatus Gottesmanbacteria bacterium GW2011_GWA1_43_11]HCS79127.1 glycosyltransferase family 2 protein [Patescibacteria group bacterium]